MQTRMTEPRQLRVVSAANLFAPHYLHHKLHQCEHGAAGDCKSLGPLQALLMLAYAAFNRGNASRISVTEQSAHLVFQDRKVRQNLCFELCHRSSPSVSGSNLTTRR